MQHDSPAWWARGLLFENCTCQLVCPGHVHFSQACTYDPCVGYWAIRVDEGAYGAVTLDRAVAVVLYEAPQRMVEGDWTEGIILDAASEEPQREALEAILCGRAGGPWAVLDRFVGRRLPTRVLPIRIDDLGSLKRVFIEGVLDARVENIRGRDRDRPVSFRNIFNQIHAPDQVIARGSTSYDDGHISLGTEGSHALHSRFEWQVDRE